jgi:hypothetical protein
MNDTASETPVDDDAFQHLHDVAALGCLLNAIAHDLNNQLTNLLLGADQAQYGGGKAAIDLMVNQAQRIADITRSIQGLGQRNMDRGRGQTRLAEVSRRWAAWVALGAEAPPELSLEDESLVVDVSEDNLLLALSLLTRSGGLSGRGAVRLKLSREEVPRSSWSGSTETISMGVFRLSSGDVSDLPDNRLKGVVEEFFFRDHPPEDVGVMAAWEIVRKVRGRLTVHGASDSPGQEIVLMLPLVDTSR